MHASEEVKKQINWLLSLHIFQMMGSSVVAARANEMVLNGCPE